MTDSPTPMDDNSDQEQQAYIQQQQQQQQLSSRLPNGVLPTFSDSSEISALREENCRLIATLVEYKKALENTRLRYGTVKKDYYAAKKRLKRLADKLQQSPPELGSRAMAASVDGSESAESTPAGTVMDDDIRKKWKEPNLKAAVKLKAAVGVHAYQSLIRDGELQLPSLRTVSRYVDVLKKAGLKPNYDFNVRDSDSVGKVFEEEEDSRDVDHNRNQHSKGHRQGSELPSRNVSDSDDPGSFTAPLGVDRMPGKIEPQDEEDEEQTELYSNGNSNGEFYHQSHLSQRTAHYSLLQQQQQLQQQQYQQQHYHQQQTLTANHIEFLKSMTGFRKKWTPFELRTCMEIRRIIGSKEYDSLRKNDGMPLPSAKTLRKYKHAAHLDGVDVMSRKRSYREMVEGLVTVGNGAMLNGMSNFGDDLEDIMNAEEPGGSFDINGLTEEQFEFLQSLSNNTKGFSDYELQKTLELKNELGGKNYEILRKQECLHVPTLLMLKKYEQENGLEDLSAMVAAEDVDEDDDQEGDQDVEPDPVQQVQHDNDLDYELPLNHFALEMNGVGEDSHMGIYEHHSIFDKDETPTFDMSKLSQQHIQFLNTLPENPKRWTPHMINSALDIKNEIGTRDYEVLRRQGIPLPAARTLRRHKDIKIRVKEEGEGA